MKYLFLLAFISFLLFNHFSLQAQITVLDYNSSTSTQYKNETVLGKDSIYIIYSPPASGFEINDATLRVSFNNEDSLNFDWFRFNPVTNQFDLIQSDDTVASSECLNAPEGGYKVHIENSEKGINTSFVAWLFIESFKIKEVRILSSACDKMILKADTAFENKFVYYDLVDFTSLELINKLKGSWKVEPALKGSDLTSLRQSFEPPVESTTFTFEAIDNFNYKKSKQLTVDEELTDKDGFPYLRAVKANFKGSSKSDSKTSANPSDTIVNPEAPYGVKFYNDSKNGADYQWCFYNDPRWKANEGDSLIATSPFFEPIDSIYYLHPPPHLSDTTLGYDVKLFAWGPIYNDNSDQCLDTLRKENFVVVRPTQFPDSLSQLPNVFNPISGTGKNKRFYFMKPLPVSVKYFSIKIYNRWGNKVYEFEDTDGSWNDNGEGWDGKTRFGSLAKPGVYYYVIYATGWDDRKFEVPGFVHIFY